MCVFVRISVCISLSPPLSHKERERKKERSVEWSFIYVGIYNLAVSVLFKTRVRERENSAGNFKNHIMNSLLIHRIHYVCWSIHWILFSFFFCSTLPYWNNLVPSCTAQIVALDFLLFSVLAFSLFFSCV